MIFNAEKTIIEFHTRVVEAEAALREKTAEMKAAARDLKDAVKARNKIMDEMANPQMALPLPVDATIGPAMVTPPDPPAAEGNGKPEAATETPADGGDWSTMGLDVLFAHGLTAADSRPLMRAKLTTFGQLLQFMAGDKGLKSLPGIGEKSEERIVAAIDAWSEANPA